jgi:chemotaxis protein CheX
MFEIACYQTDISSIVVDVFRTMLNMEIEAQPDGELDATSSVSAAVHFAGEWKGAVLIQMSPALACTLCARLLRVEPPPIYDDNVRDAMGELANMVAGNLKSVLPPGVAISMPIVVEGSDYALRVCGGNLTTIVRFSSAHGDFLCTLVEMIEREKLTKLGE